jgi:hypothetical protein
VGAAIAFNNAITITTANASGAVIADDDQGRHLAAATALILQTLHPDPRIKAIGATLLAKGAENPFFQYLAEERGSPFVLQSIINKCPDTNFDKTNASPHEQWIWERADNTSPAPKLQTMYWDCIFIANIWMTGPVPLRSALKSMAAFPSFDPHKADPASSIREHFASLERELDMRKRQFEKEVGNVLAEFLKINVGSGVSAAVEAARKAAEEAVQQAQQAAAAAAEAARRADEERRRLENEARKLKDRICKWCP